MGTFINKQYKLEKSTFKSYSFNYFFQVTQKTETTTVMFKHPNNDNPVVDLLSIILNPHLFCFCPLKQLILVLALDKVTTHNQVLRHIVVMFLVPKLLIFDLHLDFKVSDSPRA